MGTSVARIMAVAEAISCFVKRFLTPSLPCVSTFTSMLCALAHAIILFAAINVCAMPVGQAVTATTFCFVIVIIPWM